MHRFLRWWQMSLVVFGVICVSVFYAVGRFFDWLDARELREDFDVLNRCATCHCLCNYELCSECDYVLRCAEIFGDVHGRAPNPRRLWRNQGAPIACDDSERESAQSGPIQEASVIGQAKPGNESLGVFAPSKKTKRGDSGRTKEDTEPTDMSERDSAPIRIWEPNTEDPDEGFVGFAN